MQNCEVYLHTNNTDCNVPCKLRGCQKEMHHYINCPIWECSKYTTTPIPTTTTEAPTEATTSTTSPKPCPTFEVQNVLLYSSLPLNVIFLFLLILLTQFICKRRLSEQNIQRARHDLVTRRTSLLDNDNRYFSIGGDDVHETSQETNEPTENIPLLTLPNRIPDYYTNPHVSSDSPLSISPRSPKSAARFHATAPFDEIDLTPPLIGPRLEVETDHNQISSLRGFSSFKNPKNSKSHPLSN